MGYHSVPEIGRLYRRVRREAAADGKKATAHRYWKATEALRKRSHAKVARDAKGSDPASERPAIIEAYLERMRYARTKDEDMG